MPDKIAVEDLIDRIVLLEKIETGLQQSKLNQVIKDEDLDKKLPEWLL